MTGPRINVHRRDTEAQSVYVFTEAAEASGRALCTGARNGTWLSWRGALTHPPVIARAQSARSNLCAEA